jgi:pimeloyl-ACP methyl ester carboxylesterase
MPVVFLHAGVCDHRMWLDQVDAVSRAGYRAIAYDRRGFGDAASPDEPFSHLDDLATVFDALGINAAVLVGCSMGGGLAIDFALAHPERVLGIMPVGTAVTGGGYTFSGNDEAVETKLSEIEERGTTDEQLAADAAVWLDGPRSRAGRVGGAARELFYDMDRKALTKEPKLSKMVRPASAADRLGAINAPAMLVVGDLDFNYIITRHAELAAAIPGARAVTLQGTAHLPGLERPDLFNPVLIEFLARLRN